MAPHFGPTRSLGVTSELEGLLKQLLAVTVKFSNDKLIKAVKSGGNCQKVRFNF